MARAKERLLQAALDLAWSHWTGLGVRGTAAAPGTAVDPEALIYLTAALAAHDPRLRDEAADWWVRFQHHVSRPRLGRLAREFDPQIVSRFASMEASLALKPSTSGKSRLDRLDHPARALLRLRCVFGANARAEILLALLTQWSDTSEGVTASALSEVGYSKRNIALVLDDLRLAGIVATSTDANRVRYRLADAAALRNLLDPLPRTSRRWHIRIPIIASFVELVERLRDKDQMVQTIEARKVLMKYQNRIAGLGIKEPRIPAAETYWDSLQEWLIEHVLSCPADLSHRLPGMIEGIWIGPDREAWKPQRFTSAVLPALSADPDRDSVMTCLDLVQVATVDPPNDWAWVVLSDAATSTYEHTIGMSHGDPWHFATWERGRVRTYRAEFAPSLPHAQIARVYGELAAGHARRDRPAVQITLTQVDSTAVRIRGGTSQS